MKSRRGMREGRGGNMNSGAGIEGKYRLLLVEDDAVIAGGIKLHLEKWGYEVRCVEDFGNVLAEFAACSPIWCLWT